MEEELTNEPPPMTAEEEAAEAQAMQLVAETIAYRNRRRILIGIGLVVALCIGLAYLGPPSATQGSEDPAGTVETNNIP